MQSAHGDSPSVSVYPSIRESFKLRNCQICSIVNTLQDNDEGIGRTSHDSKDSWQIKFVFQSWVQWRFSKFWNAFCINLELTLFWDIAIGPFNTQIHWDNDMTVKKNIISIFTIICLGFNNWCCSPCYLLYSAPLYSYRSRRWGTYTTRWFFVTSAIYTLILHFFIL